MKSIKKTRFLKAYKNIIILFKPLFKFKISQLKKFIILCIFTLFISIICSIISHFSISSDNNKLKYCFEDNLFFINQNTTIKPIAFYNPKTFIIDEISIINDTNILYIDTNNIIKKLDIQIKLAKMHGIYGFGFYFFSSFNNKVFNKLIDIILENIDLNIHFFIILKNEEKESYYNYSINQFFNDIKKYITDNRYIKFNNKITIGLSGNINEYDVYILRQLFKKNGFGEIFILTRASDENFIKNKSFFDGIYYSTNYDSLERIFFNFNESFGYFYTHLIYYNLDLKLPKNLTIFRTSKSMIRYPICLNNSKTCIYGDYSPEKYYFLNKILIDWTLKNNNKQNQYIFLDDFNSLEPNYLFGYANINYFSKALYGFHIINQNFNLKNFQNSILILIQIHVYYIDLLEDIINKTNNIPVYYDLYITTNNEEKKDYIEKYLKLKSKAHKYEVLITKNKGRDIVPFLVQLRRIFRNYK